MRDWGQATYTPIGLRGEQSAGKSTIARILDLDYGIESFSVEAPVRSVLAAADPLIATGLPLSQVVSQLGWEDAVRHRVFGGEVTTLLDRMETAVREAFGADAWLSALEQHIARVRSDDDVPLVCVQDVRSDAEVEWIRSLGGQVWDVERSEVSGRMAHRVAGAAGGGEGDRVVVNDGTRAVLRRNVSELMDSVFGLQPTPSRPLGRTRPDSPQALNQPGVGSDSLSRLDDATADRLLRSVRNGPDGTPGLGPREDA